MKQLAFGDKRTANARADVESRLARLENVVQQFPSRIGSGQQQARRFRVTKTAHGWIKGTWILAAVNTGGSLTWSTATTADQNFDRLAIVTHVVDADHVMAACGPGLLDASWLNTSDTLFGTVKYLGTAGGYASTHQPFARPTHANLNDGWVWLYGPGFYSAIEYTNLQYLNDTNINGTGNLLTDGQPLVWNSSQSRWINGAVGAAGLPSIAGLSVLGRAANSTGTVAAITGATTGEVLQVGATTLQWAQLATASYGDGSVTAVKLATDVVLGSLHDTSVASPSDLNFLRWNAGTSKWTKYDLGLIAYTAAVSSPTVQLATLALDGGTSSGQQTLVGIGATGSRFLADLTCSYDFRLSGLNSLDTLTTARIKAASSSAVSFYDQATRTSDGTEVMRWVTSATAANRLFTSYVPFQVSDPSQAAFLKVSSSTNHVWTIASGATTFLTFDTANAWTSTVVNIGCNGIDLLGAAKIWTDEATSSFSPFIDGSSTQLRLNAGASGSSVIIVESATGRKLGFFGNTGIGLQSIGTPTSSTAGATYTAAEQTILNDVASKLSTLFAALKLYNLCKT